MNRSKTLSKSVVFKTILPGILSFLILEGPAISMETSTQKSIQTSVPSTFKQQEMSMTRSPLQSSPGQETSSKLMQIIEITLPLRNHYNDKLRTFEQIFQYPFGEDSFVIDHGADYFAFFDRLGEPHVFVGLESENVVAVAIGILRDVDLLGTGQLEKVWYGCDLKVHPVHRGNNFAQKVMGVALKKYASISTRIYGISMNPANGTNRVIAYASRIPHLNMKLSGELSFYLLNDQQLNKISKIVKNTFGFCDFVSLKGQKDLVLSSTGVSLPFLHFCSPLPGTSNFEEEKVQEFLGKGYQYMFCFPSDHSLNTEFRNVDIQAMASASIISNIEKIDWNFIRSSDI